MTKEEAQAALITVNSAILQLAQGKMLTELKVGTGNFSRHYRYGEVTMDNLKAYRDELQNIVNSYEIVTPKFRTFATIPITSRKNLR